MSLLKELFGGKKSRCCCNMQIEEIKDEEDCNHGDDNQQEKAEIKKNKDKGKD